MMNDTLEELARCFRALGYANRLELLSMLSGPRTLNEIDLGPSNPQAGENPDRTLTRQGIQYHLDQLIEEGLIQVSTCQPRGKRPQHTFEIDRSRLYHLTEQIQTALLPDTPSPAHPDHNSASHGNGNGNGSGNGAGHGNGRGGDTRQRPGVPYLAVVHGPSRGRFIALHDRAKTDERGWLIGRSEQAAIRLGIDPMVDDQHAEILPTEDGYEVLDLRTSRRTTVNWEPIPLGESRALSSGDIIGVGHSLLVFSHPAAELARAKPPSQLVTEVQASSDQS